MNDLQLNSFKGVPPLTPTRLAGHPGRVQKARKDDAKKGNKKWMKKTRKVLA